MKTPRKRKYRRIPPVFVGNYVCDFGKRHDIQEVCQCSKEYKVAPVVFRTTVASLYPGVSSKDLKPDQFRHVFETIYGR